jgi:glycosyltransferase involved in cell wall biosynthesis
MLNRGIFHPPTTHRDERAISFFRILVTGPFEVDFKNIAFTLKGISLAKEKHKLRLELIRVSQFPLTREEEEILKPDAYHVHVPHFSMGEIYRSADLFVSMSKEAEGFGLPALEAMACGVPTVLSNISSYMSFDELLDYAVFVEPADPEALANAIGELFYDRPLREKLIRRGLTVVEKFTKEAVVARLETAFNAIRYTYISRKYSRP